MLKYVIFDLDDTILDFHRGEIEGLTKIFKKYGIPKDQIKLGIKKYLKINADVWHKIEQGYNRETLLHTRFTKLFAEMNLSVDGFKVEQEYRQMNSHNYYIKAGAKTMLANLKGAGLQLIVGTNGVKKTQLRRLDGSGVGKFFNDVFISEDIGYSKPDPRFFDSIFKEKPKMNPKNSIMVGDSLLSDIHGANNVNLSSIWYNPSGQKNLTKFLPTYIASNFKSIQDIIIR